MLAARLRARCPSARVIGRAEATGFHLTFDKIGQDGSGKATLVPGDGVVPGVLFDLAAEDVHLLDRIEGLGDLPPGRPSFITRVLGVDSGRFRVGQARRARRPQIAQAPGARRTGSCCPARNGA